MHQVGKRVRSKDADYAMESISSLRRVIPEIWGAADEQSADVRGMEKKGMRSKLAASIQPTSMIQA
jgi:putative hydrolase of the HAD superfamily